MKKRYLFLILVLALVEIFFINGCNYNNSHYEKEYISESLPELYTKFFEGGLTAAQQKDLWNKGYMGKWVKWQCYVKNIDTAWHVEYELLCKKEPLKKYDIGSDVAVHFRKNQISELLKYHKNDLINFEGRLYKYGGVMPSLALFDSNIFYIRDASIITPPN